ncbi:hypothetical protein SLEP1_g18842 [Rubroshorea leprosula]|uniref:Gag-pol polyprotein n=1 Tax=Rubroshorea leprosula TaxID=152421 RepID=A0AAV5J4R1_9ROSI|nr:hypothetical protein SLEP1_g18842 [Rubroshorea leprosula]
MFVLLYKDAYVNTNELNDSLPSVVKSLSQDFKDVFPDVVPNGLPPIRGTEHQIDFIPGATIPNRPAYRSNPNETKELQRRVKELIEKGHVRESMSPCAVPVLLVPKKDGTWCMSSLDVSFVTAWSSSHDPCKLVLSCSAVPVNQTRTERIGQTEKWGRRKLRHAKKRFGV